MREWQERAGPETRGRAQVTQDERDKVQAAVTRALLLRADATRYALSDPQDGARDFVGLSLVEIGRELLRRAGHDTRGLGAGDIADRIMAPPGSRFVGMHGSSDFVAITGNVANKILRDTYAAQAQTWRAWCTVIELPDFKESTRFGLGGAPSLKLTPASGEIPAGKVPEAYEKVKLKTYSARAAINRQTIVNDDRDAFSQLPQAFATSAAAMESDVVYNALLSTANMVDGSPLFHANHANLGTVALGVAGLSEGRVAMSKQTNPAGQLLNVSPKFLIVPVALQTTAEQLVTAITPATVANVNPFLNKLTPVAEPRLDVSSAVAYFLAAQPGMGLDTIVAAYLEGQRGPRIESRWGFEVEGYEVKCVEDFGAAATEHRGLYKSAGTG